MNHHLVSTLERIDAVLQDSIAAMGEHRAVDDAAAASVKGRALLALTRLSNDAARHAIPDQTRTLIRQVREHLDREQSLLQRRLEASELVVSLIGDAVSACDWDGTYGPIPVKRLVAPAPASDPTSPAAQA